VTSKPRRAYRSRLREEQAEATRQKILAALGELIAEGHPHAVSIGAVAARAGVAEPTVFHHFPTKQALFQALASRQFRLVTEGLAPRDPAELAEAIRTVYRRAAGIEALVRWTLSNPLSGSTERPHRGERRRLLRTALGPVLEHLSPEEAARLERVVLLLSSPLAALYWKDYLGLSPDEAADLAAWTLSILAAHLSERP
jgi:AcrR family transcriptional regulator